jgi:hypothetical protein
MPLPELEVGHRFRVLGDELRDQGFGFTGESTGRPPLPDEAQDALRRAGVHRSVVPVEHSEELRRRALAMVESGASWSATGLALGVPKATVGSWVTKGRAAA